MRIEKAFCTIADQGCRGYLHKIEGPTCYACGSIVCTACSSVVRYHEFGNRRICHGCLTMQGVKTQEWIDRKILRRMH